MEFKNNFRGVRSDVGFVYCYYFQSWLMVNGIGDLFKFLRSDNLIYLRRREVFRLPRKVYIIYGGIDEKFSWWITRGSRDRGHYRRAAVVYEKIHTFRDFIPQLFSTFFTFNVLHSCMEGATRRRLNFLTTYVFLRCVEKKVTAIYTKNFAFYDFVSTTKKFVAKYFSMHERMLPQKSDVHLFAHAFSIT